MGLFDSIVGIDVFGDGKPGMLDDAVILGMLEEDEHRECKGDDDFDEEDEAIASGAVDEIFDF